MGMVVLKRARWGFPPFSPADHELLGVQDLGGSRQHPGARFFNPACLSGVHQGRVLPRGPGALKGTH